VPTRYPLLVDLSGRPCLVVGGGAVAARKVAGLAAAGAEVTVRAPELVPALAEEVAAGRVRWEQARHEPGADLGPERWWFVVAATDDAEVNDAVVAAASVAGTWANHAGAPDGGPASLPASAHDGPVTVSVSTSGRHPGAARWLRDRAMAAIGPEPAVALDLLEQLRSADRAGGGLGGRPDWRHVVDSGTLDLIREGQLAEAKERLQACLSSSSD
jgi:precorrin-2 dehydrogenase/sirohydrochlorin ferrochelatase